MSDLLAELGRDTENDEFDALWAGKFGPSETETQTSEETGETPVEETETETPATERERDAQGRFTRVDAPAVDQHTREDEIEAAEQGQHESAEDGDPVEALLAKYGGNVHAALKAAADAQGLIGRKESERAQANAEVQELRQRLEQLEQRAPQQQPPQQYRPITEADVQRIDELALSNGPQALQEAQALDPSGTLVKRAWDTWAAVAPGDAALYAANQIADSKMAQLKEELKPVLEPVAAERAQSAADQQFVQAWESLAEARPEIEQLAAGMKQVIDSRPGLARAIYEGDVETKIELLGTVADAARSLQTPIVQEAITQFEAEREQQSKQKKTQAAVTRPKAQIGSVPGGGPATEKTAAQAEAERIRAGILDSPDTSIVSGWTTE